MSTLTSIKSNRMSMEQVREGVEAGTIDTVLVSFTDMQGRMVGKRVSGRMFVDSIAENGTESCTYLLASDIENNTVAGYSIASWDKGYGDMEIIPDLSTIRWAPWLEGSIIVNSDLRWSDDTDVVESPRQILSQQIKRLEDYGLSGHAATELEFIVFDTTYREGWERHYHDLKRSSDYNIDYDLLASTRLEPLLRDIRLHMDAAGMYTEGVKGECNLGQQEIGFKYTSALDACDDHVVYKHAAKVIADQHEKSITFMAKFDEREGNSCHIHFSLRDQTGGPTFYDANASDGMSKTFRHFLAGQLHALRELTLFYAPNINSYKRFVEGSFAPTAVAWGHDNRTCAIRIVGSGENLRLENRLPGGDVNPYLAMAALIASGLYGIENELELPSEAPGNAYTSNLEHVPRTLHEARELFVSSQIAKEAFGQRVVDHYAHYAEVEINAFNSAVTDWERVRGFERM